MGSSNSHGNTRIIADYIKDTYQAELIDLNAYNIGYFNYENANKNDDFFPLMKRIIGYNHIIFISPVYWYSMSAIMKTFFDRITDLMKWHKDFGRQLRGKKMSAMSNGYEDMNPDYFFVPFEKSAHYLGMEYGGSIHTYSESTHIPEKVIKRISTIMAEFNDPN